jgi:sodium-dependent dicarboxylate transporter 2/3/5
LAEDPFIEPDRKLLELLDVEVDTRPLAMVLLSRSLRPFLLLAGAAVFFYILHATPPAGLSQPGERALAVFALCVIYWVTGALPLVITGLLAIVLLGICGVMPARTAYSLFGSEAVFFVLAAFMLRRRSIIEDWGGELR